MFTQGAQRIVCPDRKTLPYNSSKYDRGPVQRRSSTVLKTGTSVRSVASVRKRSASSQEAKSALASDGALRIEGTHSLQSFGMSSRCGYTDKVEAAAFLPQPRTPGKPSALSPTT